MVTVCFVRGGRRQLCFQLRLGLLASTCARCGFHLCVLQLGVGCFHLCVLRLGVGCFHLCGLRLGVACFHLRGLRLGVACFHLCGLLLGVVCFHLWAWGCLLSLARVAAWGCLLPLVRVAAWVACFHSPTKNNSDTHHRKPEHLASQTWRTFGVSDFGTLSPTEQNL